MPKSLTNTRILRLFNLHKLMRDMKAHSAAELATELSKHDPAINERVVKDDIAFLRQLGAEIPPGNKHSGFQYKKPFSFVSAADGIGFENAEDLLSYLEQMYSHFPRLEALGIDKVFYAFMRQMQYEGTDLLKPVQFHEVEYHGFHFIGDFYKYIKLTKPIFVRYQPFGLGERKVLFIPQLLREYNHRWFVIGTSENRENPEIFALDRVIKIEPAFNIEFPQKLIPNLSRKYKDVLGVSLEGGGPTWISLRILKPRAEYVRTKKWHRSQRVMENRENSILFCWYLWPNRELRTKILEFLPFIEEIQPPFLQDWLTSTLEESLQKLKSGVRTSGNNLFL